MADMKKFLNRNYIFTCTILRLVSVTRKVELRKKSYVRKCNMKMHTNVQSWIFLQFQNIVWLIFKKFKIWKMDFSTLLMEGYHHIEVQDLKHYFFGEISSAKWQFLPNFSLFKGKLGYSWTFLPHMKSKLFKTCRTFKYQ